MCEHIVNFDPGKWRPLRDRQVLVLSTCSARHSAQVIQVWDSELVFVFTPRALVLRKFILKQVFIVVSLDVDRRRLSGLKERRPWSRPMTDTQRLKIRAVFSRTTNLWGLHIFYRQTPTGPSELGAQTQRHPEENTFFLQNVSPFARQIF